MHELTQRSLAVFAVLSMAFAAASASANDGKLVNGIVATVDGEPITLREFQRFRATTSPFLHPDERGGYEAALDAMIESVLLRREYERNGLDPSREDVDRYIDGTLAQTRTSREQLEGALAEAGMTTEEYYQRMREEVQRALLIDLMIRSRVNVTSEEVERTWKTSDEFLEPEQVEIAHIYLPFPRSGDPAEVAAVRAQAEEIYQSVRRGGFAGAARKYSKGPTASDGGELGEFARGSMADHFETAVSGLDEGEVSRPIEADGAIHIIRLVDVRKPKRVPLADVEEQIRDRIYEERLESRYRRWAEEDLRKGHLISIYVEELALIAAS